MIREIHVNDLKIGMHVHELGLRWMNHPFLRNRFRISNQSEIEKIRRCGIATVWIDTSRGEDVPRPHKPLGIPPTEALAAASKSQRAESEKETWERIGQDTARSAQIFRETFPVVRQLMEEVRSGVKIDAHRISQQVEKFVESSIRNPGAMIAMVNLKGHDEYTFAHSIHVSVLSLALGTQIGLDRDELRLLGTGAMLHDLGKASIPLKILNKPGRLTEEEFRVIQTHPQLGVSHLAETGRGRRPEVLSCILDHHEKLDGTGYPRARTESELGRLPRIVSVADVYDALTSDRVYHKGTTPHNAVVILYGLRNTHFDSEIVNSLIRLVGVYPVASLVRLNTNEIAVVVAANPSDALRPEIEILTDPKGKPLTQAKRINLSDPSGIASVRRRSIIGPWASQDKARLLRVTGSCFKEAVRS